MDRQRDVKINPNTERKTGGRQVDKQTYRRTDRRIDRQTEERAGKKIDKGTDIWLQTDR
jgi:hypothetical protein